MRCRVLVFLLPFGSVPAITAQKIRLTDTANSWRIIYSGSSGYPDYWVYAVTARMGGDTIINSKVYQQFLDTAVLIMGNNVGGWPQNLGRFFREDTLTDRVWCIPDANYDTTAHLIYDGHWAVGDSIHWRESAYRQGTCIVSHIDSTFFHNAWYKVFHMTNSNSTTTDFDIIEGIGSICGPGFPAVAYTFENSWRLSCFAHDGIRPAISPAVDRFDNATSCTLSIAQQSAAIDPVVLIPNPGDPSMILRLPARIKTGKLVITEAAGREIFEITLRGKSEVNIGRYLSVPGVYYYTLQDAPTGYRYTGHFVYR